MTNLKNTPRHRARTAVQSPYTFEKLKNDLQSVYDPKSRQTSLRGLAKNYGVSHAVIARVMSGHEPTHTKIRVALGLPALKLAPACPLCGEVHISRRCANQPRSPTKPRRNYRRALIEAWALLWGERSKM